MKRISICLSLAALILLSGCSTNTEEEKILGTWRLYEAGNSMQIISYDSTLCNVFDIFEDDPLQYEFKENHEMYCLNLGSGCINPSVSTYHINNNMLSFKVGSTTTTYTIIALTRQQLIIQSDPICFSMIYKYVRTQ